jgi:hypothetical protein
MKLEPPVEVSQKQLNIDVSEIEPLLQGPAMDLKPWPPATVIMRDGRTMFVRAPKIEEVPTLLKYVEKVMHVERDFYDIVGARVYAELLGWYRKRIKDPYVMVGMIDGQLAGLVNGRVMNKNVNVSHHTLTFMRGGRIGAILFYCKTYYAFEILGQTEFWSTYESYNGWHIGSIAMAQPSYPWPEYQHELGGARVYYVTKEYWDQSIKNYARQMGGSDLNFNVSNEIIKSNETIPPPGDITV